MRTRTDVEQLTQEQIDKYVEQDNGSKCPFCGSGAIVGESVEIDTGAAYQDVSCSDCNKQWTDSYTLTGVI